MDLSKYTAQELEKALEAKKKQEKLEGRPKPLKDINWKPMLNLAEAIIRDYATQDYSKDAEHWCYEELLKTVYGNSLGVASWIGEHDAGYDAGY